MAKLTGRRTECDILDQFVIAVRGGASRALVVHGEAGVGKTALLQTEMELAFAALHQLCAPLLPYLDRLPDPQREALLTVFGLHSGPPPDRLLTGLAVLSLLAEAAAADPLLCLVDDVQWADRASARVLAFVGRRLGTESVGLVFCTRALSDDLAGFEQLAVAEQAAQARRDRVRHQPLDVLAAGRRRRGRPGPDPGGRRLPDRSVRRATAVAATATAPTATCSARPGSARCSTAGSSAR